MSTNKQKKRLGEKHLQRIIDLCRSIEERGVDPFLVEVDHILPIIHKYFPEWNKPEELCLDSEAVYQIASTVKLQSEWVKRHSTHLYTDPFLIEEKLRELTREEIATIFLKCWHPLLELEQISRHTFAAATKYWQSLVPLSERWLKDEKLRTESGIITREELLRQQIVTEKEFSDDLIALWEELKQKTKRTEKIEYWDFVGAETYEKTVRRAYLTSFLVTYGYATLEVDRLEEIVYVKAFQTPVSLVGTKQATSHPISVSVDDWEKWRESVKK